MKEKKVAMGDVPARPRSLMKSVGFGSREITPSKIVCVGRNYVDHINELNNDRPKEPVVFIKPNSAISDEIYTDPTDQIQFEAELSFVVWNNRLSGVAVGFDLTKRDIQSQLKTNGLPWERAKAFDKSAVFSRFVPFTGDIPDLELRLSVNDVPVQHATIGLMIFKPAYLHAHISKFMTLLDGDILMTGTPGGVNSFKRGDKFLGRVYAGGELFIEQTWTAR